MYTVDAYGRMITDTARATAYAEGLRRSIHPGSVVVDLGAGTGAFSLLACRLGAARVYAIETNPALAIARESAAANGYSDRITFLDRMSTSVELPERADVLVSDLRGTLPLFGQHISSIVDARQRFLRSGGVQMPIGDDLWVAPIHDEAAYRELTAPWSAFDLDMGSARRYALNVMQSRRVATDDVVAEPRCWASIDYRTVERPNIAGSASWKIEQPTKVNGLGLWFTAHVIDELSYSTSPFEPETVYGMVIAPLADEVELAAGDELAVRLRADLVAGSYVWTWNTDLYTGDDARAFRQSTFLSMPPPMLGDLADRDQSARPVPNENAPLAALVLAMMDGDHTIGEVADELTRQFPGRFVVRSLAIRFVTDLAEQYGVWSPVERSDDS